MAAFIGIPYSYHSPNTFVDTNIKDTLNILQTARELRVKRVVHTSTSEVYGTTRFVPIAEDHPLHGLSPYSATKIGADQLNLSFHTSLGLPINILRPFNTYGPRQSGRAVIPTIISQLLIGKKESSLGSIHPRRGLNYVEDTVDGFIMSLVTPKIEWQLINLGSGFEISIGDLAHMIAELVATEITIKESSERVRPVASEVERLLADNQKANELLKWRPKKSGEPGFRLGLTRTIEWFCGPENLKRYKEKNCNV